MFRWLLSAVLASAIVLGGMAPVNAGGGNGKAGTSKVGGGKKGKKKGKKGKHHHKKGKGKKKTAATAIA
jgi:hypothetical protein